MEQLKIIFWQSFFSSDNWFHCPWMQIYNILSMGWKKNCLMRKIQYTKSLIFLLLSLLLGWINYNSNTVTLISVWMGVFLLKTKYWQSILVLQNSIRCKSGELTRLLGSFGLYDIRLGTDQREKKIHGVFFLAVKNVHMPRNQISRIVLH